MTALLPHTHRRKCPYFDTQTCIYSAQSLKPMHTNLFKQCILKQSPVPSHIAYTPCKYDMTRILTLHSAEADTKHCFSLNTDTSPSGSGLNSHPHWPLLPSPRLRQYSWALPLAAPRALKTAFSASEAAQIKQPSLVVKGPRSRLNTCLQHQQTRDYRSACP